MLPKFCCERIIKLILKKFIFLRKTRIWTTFFRSGRAGWYDLWMVDDWRFLGEAGRGEGSRSACLYPRIFRSDFDQRLYPNDWEHGHLRCPVSCSWTVTLLFCDVAMRWSRKSAEQCHACYVCCTPRLRKRPRLYKNIDRQWQFLKRDISRLRN